MNFLSHFYFERQEPDQHVVMGVVLPDFIKNADKSWNLNPHKDMQLFEEEPAEQSLLQGWNRHLVVDRLFHCSTFFANETAALKQMIKPAVEYGPVKPFFLAHIALELVLDHLLVTHQRINIHHFYEQLNRANSQYLQHFLEKAGTPDMAVFRHFLNSFLSSKYLLSYQKIENITYALNRICMRLWADPFSEEQLQWLNTGLMAYKASIELSYMEIFDEIEIKLAAPMGSC